MDPIGIGLAACGVIFGAAGWGLTRGDRLTFGQGALCVLAGLGLVLVGALLGPLAAALAALGVPAAEGVVLVLIVAVGLALLLRQALAVSRISKELRRVATACALAAERQPPVDGS